MNRWRLFVLVIYLNFLQYKAFYIDDEDFHNEQFTTSSKRSNVLFTRKVTGYFLPPQTGEYKFYSSCDQACDVYLSGSDKPSGRSKIITQTKKTEANTYDRYPSQASHLIYLNKGKRYYIQANTKLGKPIDKSHISIGVVLPDDKRLFPIVSPYVEDVTVENIHSRQKSYLRETTGSTRAKVTHHHLLHTPEKKNIPHDKLKSKKRLQKKLAQISSFVKEMEKAKKEEDTFDNKFNDAMKNLEENLVKYVGSRSNSSKTFKTSVPKHKDIMESHKKIYSSKITNLQPKKTKSATGSSRSFKLNGDIDVANKKSLEKDEMSKQKTVEDLLDALQESLDTDSKKNKRFKYYHKKFKFLMDQINSLKGEVDKEEGAEKRKVMSSDEHFKDHRISNKKYTAEDIAESGDGSGEEISFDKNQNAEETVEKYHNEAFSTIKNLAEIRNKHRLKPVDDYHRPFHIKENKENEKENEKDEKDTEYEHKKYSSNDGRNNPSKTTLKTDSYYEDKAHAWEDDKMSNSKNNNELQNSETETSKQSYKGLYDDKNSNDNTQYSVRKEVHMAVDDGQEQQHILSPIKQGFNVGIQSADESVYRLRDDGSTHVNIKSKFQDDEGRTNTEKTDETNSINRMKEANGVVRSNKVETDLKGPLVVHATQGEFLQMTKKNDTVDKQDLKDLEDTLFKAFQERLTGESSVQIPQKSISELSPKPTTVVNTAPVKELEHTNQREEKSDQASTMVKIDTGNLQSVLEQAFNGKSTSRDNTEIESKFISSDNDKLREKLQESIESALIRSNKNVDDPRTETVTNTGTKSLDSNSNYLYKTDDNSANNIVNMYTNSVNDFKNPKQSNNIYPVLLPGQIIDPGIRQSQYKSLNNEIDQNAGTRSNKNTVDADKRNVNVLMKPTASISEADKHQNTVFMIESKNNLDSRVPGHGNYFQEGSPLHKSSDHTQSAVDGKTNFQMDKDAAIMNYASDIDASQSKTNQVSDEQIYTKISELIKEINSIKMEIVAMKRNKVTVSNYKKSLVAKLKEKTKLLSSLQAKKNIITVPWKTKS